MTFLLIFWEFFKIGIFSFGGGYATLPFLYQISNTYGWYSIDELTKMTAIAAITPGPVGINVATFAGLKTSGILGALNATTAEIIPSLIFVILVSKILKKFHDNFYVKSIIASLKPISCALLASVAIRLITSEIKDLKALLLLIFLILISGNSKRDPLFYIIISAFVGLIFGLV